MYTPNSKISTQTDPLPTLYRGCPVRCTTETKSNKSPQCGSQHPEVFKTPVSASSQRSFATNLSVRGRPLGSISGNRGPISPRRANLGSQIEALYKAKSIERQVENSEVNTEGQVEKTHSLLRFEAHDPDQPKDDKTTDYGTEEYLSPSKVLQMKRKFEIQPKVDTPKPPNSILQPLTMDDRVAEATPIKPRQPQPIPVPSPILSTRTSDISPRATLENSTLDTQKTTLSKFPRNTEPTPLKIKQSRTSNNLEDRIQLFEDIGQRKAKLNSRGKRSISAKHGNPISSRRRIFEKTFRKPAEKRILDDGQCLSVKDVRDVVDEVEKAEADRKPSKRRSFGGRWSLFPQDTTLERRSIAAHRSSKGDTINLLQRTSGSLEMVIKEAGCGLREPKPMRLVEMKRMLLLCREKAGFLSEKDRLLRAGGLRDFRVVRSEFAEEG
ncbi:hypothetical protein BJ875DRAFT_461833 [Amylocarpus encephaloides]|uniref:Uncharacterized protein n=1 Tax=Amylocarpus encephaloides TaxID=45428 RepID=A0A9P7YIR0_9HELO|nr:hypothetical protein BJ875DRAFT_461833 [Amylocarpus encephaloides]